MSESATASAPAKTQPKAKKNRLSSGFFRFVLTRFLLIIPTVFILVTIVFFVMRATGDPISAAMGGRLTPEELQRRIHAAGYDRPLVVQYLDYLGGLLRGDLGTTLTDNQPVTTILTRYGAATFELAFLSLIVALIVGIGLGRLAARRRDHAADAGIRVFATGGIGGVHRGAEKTMDISADLQELRQTSVAVVCAGAKMILDIGLTLEYLETMGVPVLGLRTDDFPAFYCRRSGFGVDHNAKDEAEIARIAKTKWDLGLAGGILIGNPVPEEYAMDFDEMTAVIEKAIAGANAEGVRGKNITPYLLAHIVEYTGGQSLKTNIQLAYNNARAAGKIAVAYARL